MYNCPVKTCPKPQKHCRQCKIRLGQKRNGRPYKKTDYHQVAWGVFTPKQLKRLQ